MFDGLRSAITTLERCAHELQVECLDGSDAAELVDVVSRGERVCSAMKSLLARRVAETGAWRDDGSRTAGHWLAEQTGSTIAAAQQAIETARALEELPTTEAAFRSGELSATQAAEITSAAREAPESEGDLLDAARSTNVKGLRDRVREIRAGTQADDAEWAKRQHARRFGRVWSDPEGSVRVEGCLPPETGARFKAVFEAEVDRIFKEARAAGRREAYSAYGADALTAMAEGRPGKAVGVKLVVEGERCSIEGMGPIPLTTARKLLQDASVALLVRDGDQLRAVGRPVRTIPARLRRELEIAYPVCGVARCSNDRFLEIDHVVPVCEGGETSGSNTWRICPHHHFLKHHRGWKVAGEPGRWELLPSDGGRAPP
jgi:hypothetical protein